MLSQTVEYALRATLYIARQSPRYVAVADVAAEVNAPRNYLGKILSQLARDRFLESARGPRGGFRLAPGARDRTLSAVVELLEPPAPRRCLLGTGECGKNTRCSVHERWAPVAAATSAFFTTTTLADLLPPEARTSPPSRDVLPLSHTSF